ncbi:MAG: hypothetical protein AAGE61_19560 [Pseudomonadota bacterium]
MTTLIRYILVSLVLGALIHIGAVIALPNFADQKVWNRLAQLGDNREFHLIGDHPTAVRLLGTADPAMVYAICRFNLKTGPVTMAAPPSTSFWNVTIFNENAEMIYNLHDGASRNGELDLELYHLSKKRQEVLPTIEDPNRLAPVDPLTPLPVPPPLTDAQRADLLEEAIERERLAREDDPTIEAILDVDKAFAIYKIFRPLSAYDGIIIDAMSQARCE